MSTETLTEYRYRAYLRYEAADTPMAEYFESGDEFTVPVKLGSNAMEDYLWDHDELIFKFSEGSERVYEADDIYEMLMAFDFDWLNEPRRAPKPQAVEEPQEEQVSEPSEPVELPEVLMPAHERQRVITLLDCDDYEAAKVLVDGELVFYGNYWDFHSGCMGTNIGDVELEGLWDEGITSLVTALKLRYMEQGFEVLTESIDVSGEQLEEF